MGFTRVSAQHITSTGFTPLPIKLRPISIQWQPMSTMAPPPDCSESQNQSLCGPGWASRERVHSTLPSAPRCTEANDFKVLGV